MTHISQSSQDRMLAHMDFHPAPLEISAFFFSSVYTLKFEEKKTLSQQWEVKGKPESNPI